MRELIESPKWSRITLINRRQADEFQSGASYCLCARTLGPWAKLSPRPNPLVNRFDGADKVEQVVVNMNEMEEHADSFKDHDVVRRPVKHQPLPLSVFSSLTAARVTMTLQAFCTFGTTRKDAGSAEAFVKVQSGIA